MNAASWIGPVMSVMALAVSGLITALVAIWRAHHNLTLKVEAVRAELTLQMEREYMKKADYRESLESVKGEIRLVQGLVTAVANRMSIPTAMDHHERAAR